MTGTFTPPGSEGATKVATTLTFNGKSEELPGIWFHLTVQSVLDPGLTSDAKKCAYLASMFRGEPLNWLARQAQLQPALLQDFDLLKSLVDEVWAIPEEARTAQLEIALHRLRCSGRVAEFVVQFDAITDELGWREAPRKTLFMTKLPNAIQEAIILEDSPESYRELKEVAIKRDTVHRAITNPTPPAQASHAEKKPKRKKSRQGGKPKHVSMIRAMGEGQDPPSFSYVDDIPVGDRRLKGLVDTAAAVNCIRATLAEVETFESTITILGPTNQLIANHPRFCIVQLDGTPQKLYLVDDLEEEIILGLPYHSRATPTDLLHIPTTGPIPDSGRLRDLSLPERDAMDKYLGVALENDWIQPSSSMTPANILFVPKKDGNLRFCVDYRPLNSVSIRDSYPIPLLTSLLVLAMQGILFTVWDITAAFHGILVNPPDRAKLAFKTLRGLYEYRVMPFGVTNGPSTYQRFIEKILRPVSDICIVYIDDILIFTGTEDEEVHRQATRRVQDILTHHGIAIAEHKSQHGHRVTYLGHEVEHGMITPRVRTATIGDWPTPRNKKELQQFLGLCNFYRSHVINFASWAGPLYPLTGNAKWHWTMGHGLAFKALKEAVLQAVSIVQFDPLKEVHIFTDASGFGVGAVLMQSDFPVAIVSRALRRNERNWTTTERELFAVVFAVRKWRAFLESTRQQINVHTDHISITQQLNANGENRRINRWIEALMPFKLRTHFVAGKLNPADIPSRRPDYEDDDRSPVSTHCASSSEGESDTSAGQEERGRGGDIDSEIDWESAMGPGYWDANGGSPQWVPGSPASFGEDGW